MKPKVGIVGLLIVLVVVLILAQPRSFLSREGYDSTAVDQEKMGNKILNIILIMVIASIGLKLIIILVPLLVSLVGVLRMS